MKWAQEPPFTGAPSVETVSQARHAEQNAREAAAEYGGEVTEIGDGPFRRGEPVWVVQADGSQRAAEYVGVGETSAWFGGPPQVIVVYPDTHSGEAVEVDRVVPRDG